MSLHKNQITLLGTIVFDPLGMTKKHEKQSSWKKVAIIHLETQEEYCGGICEYYSWFINKRFNIGLLKPIRGAHVTFINDREEDIINDWSCVKNKFNNKKIEITLNAEPRTDSAQCKASRITHNWWLNVSNESRLEIQKIRNELGLGDPFFGLHMTIGRAENFKENSKTGVLRAKKMNVEQSIYIHNLIKKGFIRF